MLFWRPFRAVEKKNIIHAIEHAEKLTSAEIRVHVDKYCKGTPGLKAANIYQHLGMQKTKSRNGILIYVSIKDKKFYVIGDIQANLAVGDDFWAEVVDKMKRELNNQHVVKAICLGVELIGKRMSHAFPINKNDSNELSNSISYG